MNENKSIVIIGEGWSALGLAGFLSQEKASVTWISGTGARVYSPLPSIETSALTDSHDELDSLERGAGAQVWAALAQSLGVVAGELKAGNFTREFRNKAFREPLWNKAPTPKERREVRDEMLWEAERLAAPVFESRFDLTLAELEDKIREKLSHKYSSKFRRIEGVPVQSIQESDGIVENIVLANGEVIPCDYVFYADRWSALSQIAGLPKGMPFTRKRTPVGVLQAVFNHSQPMGVDLQEGFYGSLHREAGEQMDRHVWGYFSQNTQTGVTTSYWTLFLSAEEVEDNHAIGKKLRRMKSALDKMFTGESWLPEGKPDFMSTVTKERVRFEEAMFYSSGDALLQPAMLKELKGIAFLTDGYGPAPAMRQVRRLLQGLGIELIIPQGANAQNESVNIL